jgi:hypothetical protein
VYESLSSGQCPTQNGNKFAIRWFELATVGNGVDTSVHREANKYALVLHLKLSLHELFGMSEILDITKLFILCIHNNKMSIESPNSLLQSPQSPPSPPSLLPSPPSQPLLLPSSTTADINNSNNNSDSTTAPVLSLYGVNIPAEGETSGFSISFIILNMIGGGLSYFVATAWSNVFQSALDRYKTQELSEGRSINPVWLNFVMAVVATVFTIAVMYLMMRMYTRINQTSIM